MLAEKFSAIYGKKINMSRIGKKSISIIDKVTVTVVESVVVVKGPNGELKIDIPDNIKVEVKDNQILVTRANDEKQTKALHGLIRSLVNNSVIGVVNGYKKVLKLVGTGYKVHAKGADLILSVGFSHPVEVKLIPGVKLTVQGNDTVVVEGINKQIVGQMAANIRAIKPPEPYKGKGIRYEDEIVRKKAGKTATA